MPILSKRMKVRQTRPLPLCGAFRIRFRRLSEKENACPRKSLANAEKKGYIREKKAVFLRLNAKTF